jgi:pimeloyl-ACP methyl ester carboxylesterase
MCISICSPSQSDCTSPILLYLPSGPSPLQWPESNLYSRLREYIASTNPSCTLVALRYRLNPPSRLFPGPIHDTAVGWEWILQTLLTSRSPASSPKAELQPRISVYGSFIGASLATMLSLTEPRYIHSLNLVNPIVDWVGLEDKPLSESPDGLKLLALREKLFRVPDHYYDPFASPVLFLRSPGRDVPSLPDETAGEEDIVSEGEETIVKRRKALRHWPPAGSDLRVKGHWRVPSTRFWVTGDGDGRQDIFRAQAEEMARLLRRSYMVNWKGMINEEEARARIDVRHVERVADVEVG